MTLTATLNSIYDRVQEIFAASPKAASVLLKYPDLLEKEPDLMEFVKKVDPQSLRIDRIAPAERKGDKSQPVARL